MNKQNVKYANAEQSNQNRVNAEKSAARNRRNASLSKAGQKGGSNAHKNRSETS